MTDKKKQFVCDLCVVIFFAVFLVYSMSFPLRARLVPLIILIPSFTMGLFRLYFDYLIITGKKAAASEKRDLFHTEAIVAKSTIDESMAELNADVGHKGVKGLMVWILGFVLLTFLIGFYLSIPLFIFAYLKFNQGRLVPSLLGGAACGGVIWLVFHLVMRMPVYSGIIFDYLQY